jgi:predicted DNA-binding transcriptional regulator YafY
MATVNHSKTKADRLLQIEALLLANPQGLTQSEIARRIGVNRSTVNRYMPDLPGQVFIDDIGRWKIDREAYLINVRFNLHEALAVHLAARLLATRMERQNPHAAAAIRKLGIALERLAPQISYYLCESANQLDDPERWQDPHYLEILEMLTLAWAEGRKVHLWHRSSDGHKINEYVFSPYFIEANAIGQSTYAIGFAEPPKALRTFKIERLERVEILTESYQIPSDFDPAELLSNAWGIWYTDTKPIEVVLRFAPHVVQRVKETRWHKTERTEMQEDGSLLWRSQVAEPLEMMPWIRGWGADVEVLEPQNLRKAIEKEVHGLMDVYNIRGAEE